MNLLKDISEFINNQEGEFTLKQVYDVALDAGGKQPAAKTILQILISIGYIHRVRQNIYKRDETIPLDLKMMHCKLLAGIYFDISKDILNNLIGETPYDIASNYKLIGPLTYRCTNTKKFSFTEDEAIILSDQYKVVESLIATGLIFYSESEHKYLINKQSNLYKRYESKV